MSGSVIYLCLQKAVYGMTKCTLLFYQKLVAELHDMGFTINPSYDPCIANKMVNGSQMNVQWHVYDLMISHAAEDNIKTFMQQINDIYGKNLAKIVGTVHDFFGMDEVCINMHQYILKVIKDFPAEIWIKCATPATNNLYLYNYKIRKHGPKLDDEQADTFHHTVYQLSFAAKRPHQDIQTAISFLPLHVLKNQILKITSMMRERLVSAFALLIQCGLMSSPNFYKDRRDYVDDFECKEDEHGQAWHSMKDGALPNP